MKAPAHRGARLCGLALLSAALSGCAVFGAGRDDGVPTLEVPEAPPRVVAEFPDDLAAPDGPAASDVPPPHEATTDVDVAVDIASEASPDPEPERELDGVADADRAPDTTGDQEAPPLQLKSDPDDDVDAAIVRRGLRNTAQILDDIDQSSLSAPGRAQRDTARRFLDQATAALQAGNITFAHYLTEKAEALARNLQNR